MARNHNMNWATADEASLRLRKGIERSRALVARYRARLMVLRQAMERQRVPPLLTVPVLKRH